MELIESIKRSLQLYIELAKTYPTEAGKLQVGLEKAEVILSALEATECQHTEEERIGMTASWTCNICGKHVKDYIESSKDENQRLRKALDSIYIKAMSPISTNNQYEMGRIAQKALTGK